jgi:hypothetical protein
MNCNIYAVALKFPGIRWYNLREYLREGHFCTQIFFVVLGMRSEGNAPQNGEPIVDFFFKTMLQHTGRFWSRIILAKNNVTTLEHPAYSPNLAAADFYLFARLKLWRHFDATYIIKLLAPEFYI